MACAIPLPCHLPRGSRMGDSQHQAAAGTGVNEARSPNEVHPDTSEDGSHGGAESSEQPQHSEAEKPATVQHGAAHMAKTLGHCVPVQVEWRDLCMDVATEAPQGSEPERASTWDVICGSQTDTRHTKRILKNLNGRVRTMMECRETVNTVLRKTGRRNN